MKLKLAALALIALTPFPGLVSPTFAQAADSKSVAAVRRARQTFNRAIERRDAAAIGRLLAPLYRVVNGRGDFMQGGQEEARRWAGRFRGDRRLRYVRTPTEITVNEEWGIAQEVGEWSGRNTAFAAPIISSGVYAARWQRAAGGEWLLVVEIFTTLKCEGATAGCVGPDPIF